MKLHVKFQGWLVLMELIMFSMLFIQAELAPKFLSPMPIHLFVDQHHVLKRMLRCMTLLSMRYLDVKPRLTTESLHEMLTPVSLVKWIL